MGELEAENLRERETETDRQTERQRQRHIDRQTESRENRRAGERPSGIHCGTEINKRTRQEETGK